MEKFTIIATVTAVVKAENQQAAMSKLGGTLVDTFPGDLFNQGVNDIAIDVVSFLRRHSGWPT